MPGPLYFLPSLTLYPFRYRDPVSGKWIRARYRAARDDIAATYAEWEIVGAPEIRQRGDAGYFSPWRGPGRPFDPAPDVDASTALRDNERPLVLIFLRRYLTYCARRRRFAQMEGAAQLYREIRGMAARG